MWGFFSSTLLLLVLVGRAESLNNGLARTPPMGWLDWERFRCNTDCANDPDNCISENLIKTMANLMVSEGYKDVGYEYVDIDDCWLAETRDQNGRLQPDPDRFPSGMKALADYVHSLGLKLGIYEDFGKKTCGGYPGSEFYLELDAQTFADWEIDLLKFDGCNSDPSDDDYGYETMSFFLNKTGRPILFSCEWPDYQTHHGISPNYTAIASTCNTWREYDDVQDSWDSVRDILGHWQDNTLGFLQHVGPGSFSDPDMLIVGDFGLSYEQQRVQMGMWAMLAAPLLMSNDLRNIRPDSKMLLQNTRVIAINQDTLGKPATSINVTDAKDNMSVWKKPLASPQSSLAIAIVNNNDNGTPSPITLSMADLGLNSNQKYSLTEVFNGTAMGTLSSDAPISTKVNPTGIVLIKAVPM